MLAITAGAVFAGPYDLAIGARQSHMRLNSHFLGVLGAMAKGDMAYDAKAAGVAAKNLAMLATINQSSYWVPGSDSFANDNTRALPALWDNIPDVVTKLQALTAASAAMNQAAGNGLDALRAAIGPVGGACSACHKAYRKPK